LLDQAKQMEIFTEMKELKLGITNNKKKKKNKKYLYIYRTFIQITDNYKNYWSIFDLISHS